MNWLPGSTGSWLSILVICKSIRGVTGFETVSVLFDRFTSLGAATVAVFTSVPVALLFTLA